MRALHWRRLKLPGLRKEHADGASGKVWAAAASWLSAGGFEVDRSSLEALFGVEQLKKANAARQSASLGVSAAATPQAKTPRSVGRLTRVHNVSTPAGAAAALPSVLSTRRAQHIAITLSRFREAREPGVMHRAILTLDCDILVPEDLPGLLSCMPTPDEANLVRELVDASGADGLNTADDFLWRVLHVPRVAPRLRALAAASTCEAGCACLLRQLELVTTACEQAASSAALRSALGIVLAVGNVMNEGNMLRGGASGFGLEMLSSLMSVRSTTGDSATLMHYCAEQLAGLPHLKLSAAALRAEIRRVPEAAMIDLGELRREATRLFADVEELADEVREAGGEAAEVEAAEEDPEARTAQLRAWLSDELPTDLWDAQPVHVYCARRACAVLEVGLGGCIELCGRLKTAIAGADASYSALEAAFGEGAVVVDGDGGGGGVGAVPAARQILLELSNFVAALEKAERDNARQQGLAATLRKLRSPHDGLLGASRATQPVTPLAPPSSMRPPMFLPPLDESTLFPTHAQPSLLGVGPPLIGRSYTTPCAPPLVSRTSSDGIFSHPGSDTAALTGAGASGGSSGGGGSGGCPLVRRSSSCPEGAACASESTGTMLAAPEILSRPRPQCGRRVMSRASINGAGAAGGVTARSDLEPALASPGASSSSPVVAYRDSDEYF